MSARHRLRLPAIDASGNRIGLIVLSYKGELPDDLEVAFVERRKKNPWSLEPDPEDEPEADPDYSREQPTESEPEGPAAATYPVIKRTWCSLPFEFLGTEPQGLPPKELAVAARQYTSKGSGRIVVIGAWDGRWVVPMFEAMRGSASVFLVDPVCAVRDDLDARSVPASQVLRTLGANMQRCAPPGVATHILDREALGLGRTIDSHEADLIVIAATLPDAALTAMAEVWGGHLRPDGVLLGFNEPRQPVEQDNLREALGELNLQVDWNAAGTVWRAKPAKPQ